MRWIRNDSAAGSPQGKTETNSEHLEEKTKEELLDDLADWMEELDENNYDEERLDAILAALDRVDPITEEIPSVEESLADFHQRYQQLLSEAEDSQKAAVPAGRSKFRFRKLSVAALAAVLLVGCAVTAQASGVVDFQDLLARWTSSDFTFSDVKTEYAMVGAHPLAEGERKEYDSLQAALDDFEVTGHVAPSKILEGFTLEEAYAEMTKYGVKFQAIYAAPDGRKYKVNLTEYDSAKRPQVETNAPDAEVYTVDGINYYLSIDRTLEKAIWLNGELQGLLYGEISRQELTELIDSIHEG